MASKHGYELVAKAIKRTANEQTRRESVDKFDELVRNIADAFADDNPKFSRYRFLAACGYEPDDPAMLRGER